MTEVSQSNPGNTLAVIDPAELEQVLDSVRLIDPEILEQADTRKLVELGAQFGSEVTRLYGSPAKPLWASGVVETDVLMTYHNGGEDGHTSVGQLGAGVPKNVLLIAKAVNEAAGRVVYDPLMRAAAFYAAAAHDRYQLCGRALLPEGQGDGKGDERLSADEARARYLAAGGNQTTATEVYLDVMATAFNPQTGAQHVSYTAWRANPKEPQLLHQVLGQELTAAADLLGLATSRGPLSALEYSIESLCLGQKNHIVQQRLKADGLDSSQVTFEQLLSYIDTDELLHEAFASTLDGQSKFLSDFIRYSDEAIVAACGLGIDDLFLGRLANAAVLQQYDNDIRRGATIESILQRARSLAGY